MIDEISQTRLVRVHADERPRIAATLAELAESGHSTLSVESVAKRGGVQEITFYTRWRTREQLVLEAMLERADEHVSVPDTASLREACASWREPAAPNLASPEVATMARAVAAQSPHDR